jgi:hypothetical protein
MPNIILNGTQISVASGAITYAEIKTLANQEEPTSEFPTVAYRKAANEQRDGTLHWKSPPLEIKDGTVINCIDTGNA